MKPRKVDANFTNRQNRKLQLNAQRHNRKIDRQNRERALVRELKTLAEPLRKLADQVIECEKAVSGILDECASIFEEPDTHRFFDKLRDSDYFTAKGDLADLARLELVNTKEVLEESRIELTKVQEFKVDALRTVADHAGKISVVVKLLDNLLGVLPPLPSEADPTEADPMRHLSGTLLNRERVKIMERLEAARRKLGDSVAKDLAPIHREMKKIAQQIAFFRVRHGV